MLTKEEEFEAWKKKTGYKPQVEEEPVNEGFLDDNDEEAPATDSLTAEDTPEDTPDEDAQELLGDEPEPAGTDGGDEPDNAPAEEPATEDGVSQSFADVVNDLKDLISTQNTTIAELKDLIAKQAEEKEEEPAEEPAGGDEFADLDLGGEPAEDDTTEDGGESTEEPAEGDEGDNTEEGGEGDNADEGGESTEEDQGEEEYDGDDESNEEKSEAYNHNMKHGKILNSNSGSITGILESGKFWKLDEYVISLAKMKARQRIEEKKREIRTKILMDSEGEE